MAKQRAAPSVRSAEPVRCLRWGIAWRARNQRDGARCYLLFDYERSLTFSTKRQAVSYINQTHGYIAQRRDLRDEPHGWFLPKAVRVRVTVEVA